MYNVASFNRVHLPALCSIASSVISIILGMVLGSLAVARVAGFQIGAHAPAATAIFLPWLFLHFLAFVPPLAFLAALKGHASPWYATLILYYLLHVVVSAFLTFYVPLSNSRYYGQWVESRFTPLLPQIVFVGVALFISTAWFVSVAPFLPPTAQTHIPALLWPDTPYPMSVWVMERKVSDPWITERNQTRPNSTVHERNQMMPGPWAICNVTGLREQVNDHDDNNAFLAPFQALMEQPELQFQACLTDVALWLYLTFVGAAAALLVLHCALLPLWPWIYKHWILNYTDRTLRVRKRCRQIEMDMEHLAGERVKLEELCTSLAEISEKERGKFEAGRPVKKEAAVRVEGALEALLWRIREAAKRRQKNI